MSQPTLNTIGGLFRDPGYEGGTVNMNPQTTENRLNSGATVIQFGRAVAFAPAAVVGTAGLFTDCCKAPAADTDLIIGISRRHPTMPYQGAGILGSANATVGYVQNAEVPVLKSGYIFAIAAENVTAEDQVLSLTAGGGTLGGSTGGAAGAGRVLVSGARWKTTLTAGTLGVIHLDAV